MNPLEDFAESILRGEEGVFMSVKNDVVGHKVYWATGEPSPADFSAGPFPCFLLHDYEGKSSHLWHFERFTSSNYQHEAVPALETLGSLPSLPGFSDLAGLSASEFQAKVEALQHLERQGELWVANLTQDVWGRMPENLSPAQLLLKLWANFLALGHSHCGGLVITKEQKFCSFSPEIFVLQQGPTLSTFPIKGTGSQRYLEQSIKEQSELSMITDLLRNDLGQVCERVWVERERYITPERHFHHARAEICGQLKSGHWKAEDYQKLLPAGSISGAPKHRVVQRLGELETYQRGFYTGTFGVRLNPDHLLTNVLIRTLFVGPDGHWHFPVGGGITIESDPAAEWAETEKKFQILRDCWG